MDKVLVVGDLHGDWTALNRLIVRRRPDLVLQCGDFGWWPNPDNPAKALEHIKPVNCQGIYWCDGNHERHPSLLQDGQIHPLGNRVYFCSRGSTLTLPDGRIVLFAGGASSRDQFIRTPGHDWFPEENISQADLDRMLQHDRVDIVVSHTCPAGFDIRMKGGRDSDANRTALQIVLEQYEPELWFFGHWHRWDHGQAGRTRWYGLDYPRPFTDWWMWCPSPVR